jgi:lysophospholipase L1-like esterase
MIRWVGKALLACIIAVIIMELALDAIYYRPPTIDTDHGNVFIENTTYRNLLLHEGFSIYPVQNEFGTYGKINRSKPVVLSIGDSFTTGLEMPPESNYVSLLNSRFSHLQFVNAGILGTAIPDQILYKPYYDTYKPVLFILQVNANDFTTNPYDASNRYHFSDNFSIVPNNVPDATFKDSLHTALYTIRLGNVQTLHKLIERLPDRHVPTQEFGGPYRIAQQMKLLTSTYGDKLVLLYVPNTPRIAENGIYSIDTHEDWHQEIVSEAKRQNIPLIDLSDPFIAYYNKTKQLPFGFPNTSPGSGHWNSVGQQIAADAVAAYVEEAGI